MSTQNSSNTKEQSNTRLEMTHNSNIDLTENKKCKPSGSQTRHDNLQAIANNINNKLKDHKAALHKDPSKSLKSINVPSKNNYLVG